MMQTIQIRQAGYPIRHTFRAFFERYSMLVRGSSALSDRPREAVKIIASHLLSDTDWQVGRSKIFLKYAHEKELEHRRDFIITARVILIQKTFKCYYYRKRFLHMRKAAIAIQKYWRRYAGVRGYRKMKIGFERLQSMVLTRKAFMTYNRMRHSIIGFQAEVRKRLARRQYMIKLGAILTIQSMFRMVLAKKLKERLKIERLGAILKIQSGARMFLAKRCSEQLKIQRDLQIEAKRVRWQDEITTKSFHQEIDPTKPLQDEKKPTKSGQDELKPNIPLSTHDFMSEMDDSASEEFSKYVSASDIISKKIIATAQSRIWRKRGADGTFYWLVGFIPGYWVKVLPSLWC